MPKTIITPGVYVAKQDTVNKYRDCKGGRTTVKKGDKITVIGVDNDESLVECAETVYRMNTAWFALAFDKQ